MSDAEGIEKSFLLGLIDHKGVGNLLSPDTRPRSNQERLARF